jgi:hypothetical protein
MYLSDPRTNVGDDLSIKVRTSIKIVVVSSEACRGESLGVVRP